MNFLFPVLSDTKTVAVSAIVSFLSQLLSFRAELHAFDLAEREVPDASGLVDGLKQFFIGKSMQILLQLSNPILFALILLWDHYGYQKNMFYVLSDLSDDDLVRILAGVGVNLLGTVLNCVCSLLLLRNWYGEADNALKAETKRHYTVQAKRRAFTRQQSVSLTKEFLDRLLSWKGALPSAFTTSGKKIETQESGGDSNSMEDGEYTRSMFWLLALTQAAITTVVGVCMVKKHDGMDFKGWIGWAFEGKDVPYPLCPAWLDECL